MLHHVTCHVTAVSCASSLSKRKIKEKRKENQYKIRKIKENKNKNVSIQASHNTSLTMSNNKVKIIQDWLEPKKVKDIQSFLGFANFLSPVHL